jgi:hypothetical protein
MTPKPVIKYKVVAATGKKVQDPEGNFIIDSDSNIEILPSFRDALWPKETHLVYPAQGAKITLGPQNPHVQRVARNAIQSLLISMCFIDAFPDITLRTKFNRDALYKSANDLNLPKIAHRVKNDIDYADTLAGLVSSFHCYQKIRHSSAYNSLIPALVFTALMSRRQQAQV